MPGKVSGKPRKAITLKVLICRSFEYVYTVADLNKMPPEKYGKKVVKNAAAFYAECFIAI